MQIELTDQEQARILVLVAQRLTANEQAQRADEEIAEIISDKVVNQI